MTALLKSEYDQKQRCKDLLTMLQSSEHPQAFVKLYLATKNDPRFHWLVKRIDKFKNRFVTDRMQMLNIRNKKFEQSSRDARKPIAFPDQ